MTARRWISAGWLIICSFSTLAGCATEGVGSWYSPIATVPPVLETDPVPSRADAADDAAIWIHPEDPASSLIVATDKQTGLLVYGLDGKQRQYLPVGNTNNVDLRTGAWGNADMTLVAASSRFPSELVLLTLDHESGELTVRARHDVDLREPYGICMYQDADQQPYVFLNGTHGGLVQYSVDPDYAITELRRTTVRSQPEGCVADDETGVLYLGEERRGIWRMSADPEDSFDRDLFDRVGAGHLIADVEGLAIYDGPRKMLIASSQGNNSFAVYDLATAEHLLSFRVSGHETVDNVSDTDGVEVTSVSLPGYPRGLLVVQDGYNTKPTANQNFKFVSWSEILEIIDPE